MFTFSSRITPFVRIPRIRDRATHIPRCRHVNCAEKEITCAEGEHSDRV